MPGRGTVKKRSVICIVALFAWIGVRVHPARAYVCSMKQAALTIVAEPGLRKTGNGMAKMETGLMDPLAMPFWEHTFTLRNDTGATLQITRLQSSCGCTTAVLGSGKTEQALPPGKTLALKVRIDPAHLRPGSVDKFVWVFVREGVAPAATIEMTGQAPALVRFSPAALDFGRVSYGQSKTFSLTAALDPRLAATGVIAQPVCSNPDVQVRLDPQQSPASASSGHFITRRYLASLSPHACLGMLIGTVSFMTQIPANLPQPERAERAADVLSAAIVPLAGEVQGDLEAEPKALAFGAIPAGRITRRQVVLSAVSPEILRHLQVICATPLLTATLLPPGSAPGANSAETAPARAGDHYRLLLEVATGADMPPGILQTQVTITTQNGERLVLPITIDTILPQIKK